jgi:hypothetical protein
MLVEFFDVESRSYEEVDDRCCSLGQAEEICRRCIDN